MYNLRYHLASLASVFLALAVGLLLGGLIADRAPTAAQDVLVKGIERDIAQAREDNAQLKGENKNISDFSDLLLQAFSAGRLAGTKILVLGNNDKDTNAAVTVLEVAGAETIVVLPTYDAELEKWIIDETVFESPLDSAAPLKALVNVSEPTGEDGSGTLDSYIAFLQDLGERVQLPLICASSDNETTQLVEAAWKAGISGTNQLQNRFGAYTLVALLADAQPGLYGTTPNATALFPPLPPAPITEPVVAEDTTP